MVIKRITMKTKQSGGEKIEFRCNKCEKPQKKDDKQSNDNWSVFKAREKCSCGGEFVMFFEGEQL